jgi:hypothetical protein
MICRKKYSWVDGNGNVWLCEKHEIAWGRYFGLWYAKNQRNPQWKRMWNILMIKFLKRYGRKNIPKSLYQMGETKRKQIRGIRA